MQVADREDRIPRAPQQQRGHIGEIGQTVDHAVQGGAARVAGLQRDVGDEVTDGAPAGRRSRTGSAKASRTAVGQRRSGQRRGGADERRRPCADRLQQRPDRASRISTGRRGAGGQGDAGVGEHDAGQQLAVPSGPTEQRPVRPSRGRRRPPAQSMPSAVGQPTEVVDPLGQRPRPVQAFRPAHAELVGRDHPPAGRGGGQEPAPQVGPGRVAVHAEQRAGRRARTPLSSTCQVAGPVGVDTSTSARPGRVQAGQRRTAERAQRGGRVTRRSRRRRCSTPSRCPAAGPGRRRAAVRVLGQGERHGGRAHVPVVRQGQREALRIHARARRPSPDVHDRGLVGDEPVDPCPVELRLGVASRWPSRARGRRRTAACCRSASGSRSPTHRSWCSVPARLPRRRPGGPPGAGPRGRAPWPPRPEPRVSVANCDRRSAAVASAPRAARG